MKYESWCVAQIKKQTGKPWQAILKYKNEEGKWRNKKKTLGVMGKKEAERQAEQWFNEMNAAAEKELTGKGKTVSEVLLEYYDNALTLGHIEKSTHHMYMNHFKNNIEPYIGGLEFAEVDRTDLELWITKLHQKGLKQNTIYNCWTVPKTVYSYYFRIGEISKNPFLQLQVPKGDKVESHMTREQMDNFLEALYLTYDPEDPMYVGLLLDYFCGLRRSELCALRWRDIDFERNTLTVSSAIGIGYRETYLKNPKNKSSRRSFPMMPQVREALMDRYNAIQPENSWFVLGEKEKYMTPATFTHRMDKLVKANDLKDIYGQKLSSHKLRHNLGMMGIKSQMDISSLSRMFGHSSRSMTLDRYGDYSPDAAIVAAGKLSKEFKKDSYFTDAEEEEE